MMRIAVGTDKRGEEIAQHVVDLLTNTDGVTLHDFNDDNDHPNLTGTVDYPEEGWRIASAVLANQADMGILVSGSGIGMCMTANKLPGIRAVIAHDEWIVRRARAHHDCNMLCIPADLIGLPYVQTILDTWLKTSFEAGRHERRVKKMEMVEQGNNPANFTVQ